MTELKKSINQKITEIREYAEDTNKYVKKIYLISFHTLILFILLILSLVYSFAGTIAEHIINLLK